MAKHSQASHDRQYPEASFSAVGYGRSSWWRHQMETFSALLATCAGNSAVPGESPHKGQWRGAMMFSFICVWINGWVNNSEAGDLRRYRAHCDVIVMSSQFSQYTPAAHRYGRDINWNVKMSFWWNFRQWLHGKLVSWQPLVQPVMKISFE